MDVARRAAGHVVDDDLRACFRADRLVMLFEAFLRRIVVVTRDAEHRDLRYPGGRVRSSRRIRVCSSSPRGDDRYAPVHVVERELDGVEVLLGRKRRALARGDHRQNSGGARVRMTSSIICPIFF